VVCNSRLVASTLRSEVGVVHLVHLLSLTLRGLRSLNSPSPALRRSHHMDADRSEIERGILQFYGSRPTMDGRFRHGDEDPARGLLGLAQ
jgi:hypothetical protein